jgi:hypothetical protein
MAAGAMDGPAMLAAMLAAEPRPAAWFNPFRRAEAELAERARVLPYQPAALERLQQEWGG